MMKKETVFSAKKLLFTLFIFMIFVSFVGADDSLVLKVGTVLRGDGRILKNAVIVIKDGKIDSIRRDYGTKKDPNTLEFENCVATPGFIAANADIDVVKQTNEERSEFTPLMNLLYSINPRAVDFEKAWRNGVTCVYLAPGNSNVFNGTGTVLKTKGSSPQEMFVKNEVHLKVTLGREPARGNRPPSFRGPVTLRNRRPQNRMGIIFIIRNGFINLQNRSQVPDSKLSSEELLLRKVLRREIPLRIRARSYMDIKSAFRMMEEFGYRWILEDGTDAHKYLDELRKHGIPVVYGPVYKTKGRRDFNRENDFYLAKTPLLLARKGIMFAFQNNPESPISELRDEAMYAVQLGLAKDTALKALTFNAAKILGVEDRLGTIDRGKDADILIFSGDPFEPRSRLKRVIINGNLLDPNK